MPWLGPLLVAGSAAVGRMVAVNLAPTTVLAVTVWLTLRANAFTMDGLTARHLFSPFDVDAGGVLLFVVFVVGLAIVLQPFEIRTVRLLEGYWGVGPAGVTLARLKGRRHRRRLLDVMANLEADDPSVEEALVAPDRLRGLPVEEQAQRHRDWRAARRRAARAKKWRPYYPPSADEVMPTLLGNVLRAYERRAGERYHLSTVTALPRLNQHLSERMAAAYNGAVDALDAAAMMTISAGLSAVVGAAAFHDDPALYWLPISLAVVTFMSYRGAVVAAVQHGLYLETAFDLHRFDMIKALHLDLPRNVDEERMLAERLERFWASADAADARDEWDGVRYWHYDEKTRPAYDLDPPDDETAAPGRYL